MKQEEFVHIALTDEERKLILQQPVLVALSGDADSVALLRVLIVAGGDCRAAHCNFHLRGEESMRDELFVRELCHQLDIPLIIKDFNVSDWQQEHGGSVEMACRQLRYEWFEQERQLQGCGLIAVAHHADDQVETFFLNLLRGTGTRGLTGMQRLNGNIWRPLLDVTRSDILNYLNDLGQDYVTDSTNDENDYRRNRLRNIVLPVIEQEFQGSRSRILDTMGNLSSDHDLLNALTIEVLSDERHIDIASLCGRQHAPTLLYHRIRHLGFNREQCQQAIEAAQQGHSGRQFPSSSHILVVNRQTIDIEPIEDEQPVEIPFDFNAGLQSPVHITVTRGDAPFSPRMCEGKQRIALSKRVLECNHVVLRHWKQGDRIKPFGLHGSKLVSDLFADLKFDHAEKHQTWLLEADGDIIWIVGHRASALYPVNIESQDYLLLALI